MLKSSPMVRRFGAGSNAALAIQGSSSEGSIAPAPEGNSTGRENPSNGSPGQLTYTWSIPAVPPSPQVLLFSADKPMGLGDYKAIKACHGYICDIQMALAWLLCSKIYSHCQI